MVYCKWGKAYRQLLKFSSIWISEYPDYWCPSGSFRRIEIQSWAPTSLNLFFFSNNDLFLSPPSRFSSLIALWSLFSVHFCSQIRFDADYVSTSLKIILFKLSIYGSAVSSWWSGLNEAEDKKIPAITGILHLWLPYPWIPSSCGSDLLFRRSSCIQFLGLHFWFLFFFAGIVLHLVKSNNRDFILQ